MYNDEQDAIGTLRYPELRSASRLLAPDLSLQSMTFSFPGIGATGDTTEQLITDRNIQPFHIGNVAGQPLAAYLMIRDCFVTVQAVAGVGNIGATIIYRDTSRIEHYLGAIGVVALAASGVQAFNMPRLRLLSEKYLDEKERVNFGAILVRTHFWSGANSVNVNVFLNIGMQYAI